jgi:hypothetical protein
MKYKYASLSFNSTRDGSTIWWRLSDNVGEPLLPRVSSCVKTSIVSGRELTCTIYEHSFLSGFCFSQNASRGVHRYVKQWRILIPVMLTSRLHFLTNRSVCPGRAGIPHKYFVMLKEDKRDGPSVGGLRVALLILFRPNCCFSPPCLKVVPCPLCSDQAYIPVSSSWTPTLLCSRACEECDSCLFISSDGGYYIRLRNVTIVG